MKGEIAVAPDREVPGPAVSLPCSLLPAPSSLLPAANPQKSAQAASGRAAIMVIVDEGQGSRPLYAPRRRCERFPAGRGTPWRQHARHVEGALGRGADGLGAQCES